MLSIDVNVGSPLAGSDLLPCAIFGGAISGLGSGLTIRNGGAIDGIDVLVGSKTIDYIVDGFDREKCAMIVTAKADEITSALNEAFGSS